MKTVLTIYFLFVGIMGALKSLSGIQGNVVSSLIMLGISFGFIYIGLKLTTLLPKHKRKIQVFVTLLFASNLATLYLGLPDANQMFLDTDLFGKILLILMLTLIVFFWGLIIYFIESVSNKIQSIGEEKLEQTP